MTQLMGHVAHITSAKQSLNPANLSTPSKNITKSAEPQSSPIPHDSDIPNFLRYAEEKLGVRAATDHSVALETHHYGPDILAQVPDVKLEEIGIPAGDALRLKKGCTKWYHSGARKRTLEEMRQSGPSGNNAVIRSSPGSSHGDNNEAHSSPGLSRGEKKPKLLRYQLDYHAGGHRYGQQNHPNPQTASHIPVMEQSPTLRKT